MAGQGTPATVLLRRRGVAHALHDWSHPPRASSVGPSIPTVRTSPARPTTRRRPRRSGLDPARVFKTLVADVDGRLTVGVVAVAANLDLKALAAAVAGKGGGGRRRSRRGRNVTAARMAETAAAERATGYVAGGISPLGQRKRLPTVIDATARDFDTVFCSAGRRGLEVELAAGELAELTGATFVAIAAV